MLQATPTAAQSWDAIVIGSGLGGLTSAAYLATNGLRTLVLEQHSVAGGCSQVFRRNRQFEFDVGVHYIGDCDHDGLITGILGGLGLGGKIEFLPMDAEGFDTLLFPGMKFRVRAGWERYESDLVACFPAEQRAVRNCVAILRQIAEQTRASSGAPSGLLDLLKLPLRAQALVRWRNRTLGDLFDNCRLSERARAVLAAESGTYGAPPSRASVLQHAVLMDSYLRGGAFYPRGGGQVIAAHLIDVIHSYGGRVRTMAGVERILIEGGRATGVRLRNGEQLRAPVVISDADYKRTHLELVGAEHLSRRTLKRVGRMRMALPLFCVYLGLDIDLSERMPNTNYLLYPDWDIEAPYEQCYAGRFPRHTPVFMTAASVKDPNTPAIAPAGCGNLQLMAMGPASHAFWQVAGRPGAGERYSRNPAYRAIKQQISEQLIDGATQVIPDIREHIIWQEAASPITLERYTGATGGTSYGLEHSPEQWGLHRPRPQTEIGGLFLAGASTLYAHGVAGVMLGGLATAGVVLKRDLQAELRAGRRFGDPSRLHAGGPDWDPLAASRRLSEKRPEAARARAMQRLAG